MRELEPVPPLPPGPGILEEKTDRLTGGQAPQVTPSPRRPAVQCVASHWVAALLWTRAAPGTASLCAVGHGRAGAPGVLAPGTEIGAVLLPSEPF